MSKGGLAQGLYTVEQESRREPVLSRLQGTCSNQLAPMSCYVAQSDTEQLMEEKDKEELFKEFGLLKVRVSRKRRRILRIHSDGTSYVVPNLTVNIRIVNSTFYETLHQNAPI